MSLDRGEFEDEGEGRAPQPIPLWGQPGDRYTQSTRGQRLLAIGPQINISGAVRRSRSLKCATCKEKGASLGCYTQGCQRVVRIEHPIQDSMRLHNEAMHAREVHLTFRQQQRNQPTKCEQSVKGRQAHIANRRWRAHTDKHTHICKHRRANTHTRTLAVPPALRAQRRLRA